MPEISIIIPIYNTQKYIEKCLRSLEKQTMKNFEIILVNDGSTDNTEKIVKRYINEHKNLNIIYIKKENEGLASARNCGVTRAKGKYISFLDSDDYLDNNLFQNLKQYMDKDVEMIKFKMQKVEENGKVLEKIDGPVFDICTGEEAFKKLCIKDKYIDPACIYLYKREFFVDNNFEYKLRYHEDFGLTPLIIIQAKTFVSTNYYGYYYLQTAESLTRSTNTNKNIARAKDMLAHYDNMIVLIDAYSIKEETKRLVKRYYTNSVILKANTLKGKDKSNYIKEIKLRRMYKNIQPENLKQKIKRLLLKYNVRLYLKMRSKICRK